MSWQSGAPKKGCPGVHDWSSEAKKLNGFLITRYNCWDARCKQLDVTFQGDRTNNRPMKIFLAL